MNLEEARKLPDEGLWARVAALCGWTYEEDERKVFFVKDGDIVGYDWPSLDAMHEAVKTLGAELGSYEYWLEKVAGPGMCMVEATARQRAEAFVLSVGAE